jgi:hypothetical protein
MRSIFSTDDKSGESRASKNWLILIGAVLGVALILFGSTAKKSEALDTKKKKLYNVFREFPQ